MYIDRKQGYIYSWRSIWGNAFFLELTDKKKLAVLWLIHHVAHSDMALRCGDDAYLIKAGEFIFSLETLMDKFNMTKWEARKFLDELEAKRFLVRKNLPRRKYKKLPQSSTRYFDFNSPLNAKVIMRITKPAQQTLYCLPWWVESQGKIEGKAQVNNTESKKNHTVTHTVNQPCAPATQNLDHRKKEISKDISIMDEKKDGTDVQSFSHLKEKEPEKNLFEIIEKSTHIRILKTGEKLCIIPQTKEEIEKFKEYHKYYGPTYNKKTEQMEICFLIPNKTFLEEEFEPVIKGENK